MNMSENFKSKYTEDLQQLHKMLEEIKVHLEKIEKLLGHFVFLFRTLNQEQIQQLGKRKIVIPKLILKAKDE